MLLRLKTDRKGDGVLERLWPWSSLLLERRKGIASDLDRRRKDSPPLDEEEEDADDEAELELNTQGQGRT